MPLNVGTRLGPYEILGPIGAGGMGEVYRARDTRLDRIVAVKVLPSHVASDPVLRERFEREARSIAALNHPHICTLHDVGRQDGIDFLVMECLDGETLAERVAKKGLPVDEALAIAIQIADALDKAHRAGIVHRDLKPGNIVLTKSGAKLLDFGLAKAGVPIGGAAGLSISRTVEAPMTAQGTILGTLQYMAPEQVEGRDADARSDIFALGAVTYEMITGMRAFEGKSPASVIAAILEREPAAMSSLRPLSPRPLDHVVQRCLAKDSDERWQSAGDVMRELKWIRHAPAPVAAGVTTRSLRWRAAIAVLLLIVAAGLIAVARYAGDAGLEPAYGAAIVFTVAPPGNTTFVTPQAALGLPWLALSPDGRVLAFVALAADGHQQLWTRPLAAAVAAPLAGTDGASAPFWSPDSQSIAFFAQGQLKYVDTRGGTPQVAADAARGGGGSWSAGNIIVFNGDPLTGELRKVRVGSRTAATPLTRVDTAQGQRSHVWPAFLPDGRHFLFAVQSGSNSGGNDVMVGSVDGGEPAFLLRADGNALYASGYVLYRRAGTLMAERFDARAMRLDGDPIRIVEAVGSRESAYTAFSVSKTGALAYGANLTPGDSRPVWRNRSGGTLNVIAFPTFLGPSLSRDGSLLALGHEFDIWLYDTKRGTPVRLTFDATGSGESIWSPDGKYLALRSRHGGHLDQLFRKLTNGTGPEERLSDLEGSFPTD
jgi:eukaryotic-like serine/threonine-protein kinase